MSDFDSIATIKHEPTATVQLSDTKLAANLNLMELVRFFDMLPKDPYVSEGFRYKSIAWVKLSTETKEITRLPNAALCQSSKYNPVHGDLKRQYSAIPDELLSREDFKRLLLLFGIYWNVSDEDVLLVQLQRIICSDNKNGSVAVEGFHQDDIDQLQLIVVDRQNITGGETQISKTSTGNEIIFRHTLLPGESVFINDRNVYHYGTEIELEQQCRETIPKSVGKRDIIIICGPAQHLMA